MSGLDQLQYLSWLLYLVVFVLVLVRAARRPTPAHVDMALFFGATALVIVLSTLTMRLHVAEPGWLAQVVTGAALLSLGYLLLRLVRDFSEVPQWLLRAVEIGLAASVLALIALPMPMPPSVALLLVAYLVLVIAYDTWAFLRQARRSRGVTRRRMQAAAAGSLSLALVLVVAGIGVGLPDAASVLDEISAALGLLSGACYFVGFAPPTWLRRAWQEPELRSVFALAASVPRLPDTASVVRELERGAANALGAAAASVALWNPDSSRLEFNGPQPPWASVVDTTARVNTGPHLEVHGGRAVLSAPIIAGDKRLGVLVVYTPRAPIFANSDLELVRLLADQAAIILESRRLVEESARVHARDEAARLKEDFLSSAAHDLKTPLTGLVTQAQVLQRRAQRNPEAPVDRAGVDRLLEQSLRLKNLVLKLLDVTRLEQGGLLGERVECELGHMVKVAIKREPTWRRVAVQIEGPAPVALDTIRFEQVLVNLVENALKYSPHDSRVVVRVWADDAEARLSVADRGIGIPTDDQPRVFDRFHRGANVDDRRFAGMGLGLYIARGIVEQHGGRIWVESTRGVGSTFFVALPRLGVQAEPEPGLDALTAAPADSEGRLASA